MMPQKDKMKQHLDLSCAKCRLFGHREKEHQSPNGPDSLALRTCSAVRIYNNFNPGWPVLDVTAALQNGIFLMDKTSFLFSRCANLIVAHF